MCQAVAFLKRIIPDLRYSGGNRNSFQRRALRKGGIADLLKLLGKLDRFQAGAAFENRTSDPHQAFRKADLLQFPASPERARLQCGNSFRDFDPLQTATGFECAPPDVRQRIRQGNFRQVRAFAETVVPDSRNAVLHNDALDLIRKPVPRTSAIVGGAEIFHLTFPVNGQYPAVQFPENTLVDFSSAQKFPVLIHHIVAFAERLASDGDAAVIIGKGILPPEGQLRLRFGGIHHGERIFVEVFHGFVDYDLARRLTLVENVRSQIPCAQRFRLKRHGFDPVAVRERVIPDIIHLLRNYDIRQPVTIRKGPFPDPDQAFRQRQRLQAGTARKRIPLNLFDSLRNRDFRQGLAIGKSIAADFRDFSGNHEFVHLFASPESVIAQGRNCLRDRRFRHILQTAKRIVSDMGDIPFHDDLFHQRPGRIPVGTIIGRIVLHLPVAGDNQRPIKVQCPAQSIFADAADLQSPLLVHFIAALAEGAVFRDESASCIGKLPRSEKFQSDLVPLSGGPAVSQIVQIRIGQLGQCPRIDRDGLD